MKNNIEEDIKIVNKMIEKSNIEDTDMNDILQTREIEATKNILADRERMEKENKKQKENVQRMQELLDKSDASNIELQKEIETLKGDTY